MFVRGNPGIGQDGRKHKHSGPSGPEKGEGTANGRFLSTAIVNRDGQSRALGTSSLPLAGTDRTPNAQRPLTAVLPERGEELCLAFDRDDRRTRGGSIGHDHVPDLHRA